jgi:hypothetical protein
LIISIFIFIVAAAIAIAYAMPLAAITPIIRHVRHYCFHYAIAVRHATPYYLRDYFCRAAAAIYCRHAAMPLYAASPYLRRHDYLLPRHFLYFQAIIISPFF